MKWHSFIIIGLVICSFTLKSQDNTAKLIDWKFLADVKFEDKYYEEFEAWYLYPIFSEKIKALDGKRVIIKGYIIPLDVDGGIYALSAYPFSSCFFCGGAGPESVMTINFKGSHGKYKTDDVVTFTGKLGLNNNDVEQFNYILNDAEEISKS
jgi:hypothetical protein